MCSVVTPTKLNEELSNQRQVHLVLVDQVLAVTVLVAGVTASSGLVE